RGRRAVRTCVVEEAVRLDAEDHANRGPTRPARNADGGASARGSGGGEEQLRSTRAADTEVDRVREIAVRRVIDARLLRRADPDLERVDGLGRIRDRLVHEVGARERIRGEPATAVVRGYAWITRRRVAEIGPIAERERASTGVGE